MPGQECQFSSLQKKRKLSPLQRSKTGQQEQIFIPSSQSPVEFLGINHKSLLQSSYQLLFFFVLQNKKTLLPGSQRSQNERVRYFFPVLQLFSVEKYLQILNLVSHGSFFIKKMLIFLIAFLAKPLGYSPIAQ